MRSDFPASGKGEAVLESALASQLTQFGADTAGYSGLEDEVDNHWKELLGAAALSTLLAVGTEVNAMPLGSCSWIHHGGGSLRGFDSCTR
jgi:hypothetical protein